MRALHLVTRMCEAIRSLAGACQQQQTLRIEIKPANEKPFTRFQWRERVKYRWAMLRVRMSDNFSARLVVEQDARQAGGILARKQLSVNADLIRRHDALANMRRFAIDRDAARHNPLFHFAPRTNACLSKHLVQFGRIVLHDWRIFSDLPCIALRSPYCSYCLRARASDDLTEECSERGF